MPTPHDPLDPLLDRWADVPAPPSDLSAEVWRRIAQNEEALHGPEGFWSSLDALMSRPPFAALFVTSCALLGLFLAEVRINHQQRDQSTELARSYVQLIDPLLEVAEPTRMP
jgi:hypothetical protein